MGVTEQLKKLHKQKKIRTSDIPTVVHSGVDVDTYLGRARTLESYKNPTQSEEPVEAAQVEPVEPVVQMMANKPAEEPKVEEPKIEEKSATIATTSTAKATSSKKRSIIRDL